VILFIIHVVNFINILIIIHKIQFHPCDRFHEHYPYHMVNLCFINVILMFPCGDHFHFESSKFIHVKVHPCNFNSSIWLIHVAIYLIWSMNTNLYFYDQVSIWPTICVVNFKHVECDSFGFPFTKKSFISVTHLIHLWTIIYLWSIPFMNWIFMYPIYFI
jgi:hypothetical protein